MISVIIPAHNEAAVIARTLDTLTRGAAPHEMEVVVACNGCHDATAQIARSFGEPVRVIEVAEASKIAALNAGDAAARGFPRFYVDADVLLTFESVRAVARVLQEGAVMAAAPRMRVDLEGASWPVRAFYRVWLRQPYHVQGHVGSGVYAVSRQGRKRFGRFPAVIADDEFFRLQFAPHERRVVEEAEFQIVAPRRLWGLIRVKTRSRLGLYQLRTMYPHLRERRRKRGGRAWRAWEVDAGTWPDAAAYVLVNLITRVRARLQMRRLARYRWERDESSRVAASA